MARTPLVCRKREVRSLMVADFHIGEGVGAETDAFHTKQNGPRFRGPGLNS